MTKSLSAIVIGLALAALTGLSATSARAQEGTSAQETFTVAVLPFESSDAGKARDLQKKMIEELNELGVYTLVDTRDVNRSVEGAGLRAGAPIPAVAALEIGRNAGARFVVRGELRNVGGSWEAVPVFVEVTTRNTQEFDPIREGNVDRLGEKIVQSFNNRNQALKHLIFGQDYIRGENYARAITNFDQALEYDPQLAAAHYWKGEAYMAQDQVDQALASLEEAIRIDPSYINAYHTIGQAYLEKGDTTQARNFFEQLVRSKPDDCDTQVAYGYVMANELGEVEKGLAAFQKAQQLCPDNPLAYQYYAFALPDERRPEKIDAFKRYLALSEGQATDPQIFEYLFGLLFAAEQYEEAREMIDQAVAGDPTDANLQFYAGVVRDKLGQYQEAIAAYDRALAVNPQMERAYIGKALAYKELGNQAQYIANLEKAGRDASRIIAGQTMREAFQMLQRGQAASALETARRGMRLGGDPCVGNYVIGAALYDLGKAAQGEEKSMQSNQRSIDLFNQAIGNLRNACGTYASYAQGLIGNSNQYIERGNLILRKQGQAGR
ncbi:MAG TPA: tetratricopeptide repeat protein [Gemmatimonadota bacterium]|nr:tetratricopeptide repeat protein [Gemmatimonadota bacterium]